MACALVAASFFLAAELNAKSKQLTWYVDIAHRFTKLQSEAFKRGITLKIKQTEGDIKLTYADHIVFAGDSVHYSKVRELDELLREGSTILWLVHFIQFIEPVNNITKSWGFMFEKANIESSRKPYWLGGDILPVWNDIKLYKPKARIAQTIIPSDKVQILAKNSRGEVLSLQAEVGKGLLIIVSVPDSPYDHNGSLFDDEHISTNRQAFYRLLDYLLSDFQLSPQWKSETKHATVSQIVRDLDREIGKLQRLLREDHLQGLRRIYDQLRQIDNQQ